jgi:hypothetical protein
MLAKDIISNIISVLNKEFHYDSFADLGNGVYELYPACGTKWLHVGMTINDFRVIGVEVGNKVTVQNKNGLPLPLFFNIPNPNFIYGEYWQTSAELANWKFQDKTPFVWLRLTGETKEITDQESEIGSEAYCELYILSACKYAEWTTQSHFIEVIEPLISLKNAIITGVIDSINVVGNEIKEMRTKELVKFGKQDENGKISRYFEDDLSGWRIAFTMPTRKEFKCDC